MNYKHQGKNKIVKDMPAVDNNRATTDVYKAKWKCLNAVLYHSHFFLRRENLGRILCLDLDQQEHTH